MKSKILKILSLTLLSVSFVSCSNANDSSSTSLDNSQNSEYVGVSSEENITPSASSEEVLLTNATNLFYKTYAYDTHLEYASDDDPSKLVTVNEEVIYQDGKDEELDEALAIREYNVKEDGTREYSKLVTRFVDKEKVSFYTENYTLDNQVEKNYLKNYNSLFNFAAFSPFSVFNANDFVKKGDKYGLVDEKKFSTIIAPMSMGQNKLNSAKNVEFKMENGCFTSVTGQIIQYNNINGIRFKEYSVKIDFKYDNIAKIEHLNPLPVDEEQKKIEQPLIELSNNPFIVKVTLDKTTYTFYKAKRTAFLMWRNEGENENVIKENDIWINTR